MPSQLAHYAIVYARAWAADSINARVRLAAENDRLHEDCGLLREELCIQGSRMAQIALQPRPHYGRYERMASSSSVPREHGLRSRRPRPSLSRQPRSHPG